MNKLKYIPLLFVAFLLVGCGPVKVPPVSSYTISPMHQPKIPRYSRTHLSLLVTTPIASPGYQSNKMIYVNIPYRLKAYANHQWVAPPATMLLPMLAERIRSTGYFKAVMAAPFSGSTNYRLDTQLIMLQQEFITPTSKVQLAMQATLLNNRTNRIIASRRFMVTVPAPENNPYSGVLATNKAATTITKQIAQFVLNSLRRR